MFLQISYRHPHLGKPRWGCLIQPEKGLKKSLDWLERLIVGWAVCTNPMARKGIGVIHCPPTSTSPLVGSV
ncbi:MAG: hypothetical protein F6K50_54820 [Moorea sp. SIO3I7]|nr:hypothetical protein [Moorena sp. SIO3I7]NEO50367.1 hypothetical protein [Moorena sp. SIO4A3]